MNVIIQMLGFAALTKLVIDFIETLDTNLMIPERPFKCDLCMGFWVSLVPFMLQEGLAGILYAAMTGVLANYIYKKL